MIARRRVFFTWHNFQSITVQILFTAATAPNTILNQLLRRKELSKLFLLGLLTEVHFHAFPQERHAISNTYDRLRNTFSASTHLQSPQIISNIHILDTPAVSSPDSFESCNNLDKIKLCITCKFEMIDDEGRCQNCTEYLHCADTICYISVNGPLTNYINEKWCSSCYNSIPE